MEFIKTQSITQSDFKTVNTVRTHTVLMDNMPENGGQDYGASPKEHLCMALGSCTTMTIQTFLNRKQWCCTLLKADTTYEVKDGKPHFTVHVIIQGEFNEQQQKRIKQIAKFCPVQKMLSAGNDVIETFEFID